jgi:hypothetical protein
VDPQVRKAIREPVHRRYVQALRPMLEAAVGSGELAPDTDVDALLSVVVLLLPHLALAPFEPGLDAGLALYGTEGEDGAERARRLVTTVFAGSLTRTTG